MTWHVHLLLRFQTLDFSSRAPGRSLPQTAQVVPSLPSVTTLLFTGVNILLRFATGALYVAVRLFRSNGKITVCFFTLPYGALWITIRNITITITGLDSFILNVHCVHRLTNLIQSIPRSQDAKFYYSFPTCSTLSNFLYHFINHTRWGVKAHTSPIVSGVSGSTFPTKSMWQVLR